MNRVPASLAVVMLAASGHPVSPITLRSWVYRGHISRQEGGYDLREILRYIEIREKRMRQIRTWEDLASSLYMSRWSESVGEAEPLAKWLFDHYEMQAKVPNGSPFASSTHYRPLPSDHDDTLT